MRRWARAILPIYPGGPWDLRGQPARRRQAWILSVVFALILVSPAFPQGPSSPDWISVGPPGGGISSLEAHPSNPDVMLAAAYSSPGQILISTDAGRHWRKLAVLAEKISDIEFAPSQPETIYALGEKHVYKSVDGGFGWVPLIDVFVGPVKLEGGAMAVHPLDADVLYAGGQSYVSAPSVRFVPTILRSFDGGVSWTRYELSVDSGRVSCVVIDPTSPQTLFAGIEYDDVSVKGKFFKTINGGNTWTDITGPINTGVEALALDVSNPSRIFATTRRNIFRSADGGATWTVSDGEARGHCLTIDLGNPNVLYAGWESGFYKSTDSGLNWTSITGTVSGTCTCMYSRGSSVFYGSTAGLQWSGDGGASWGLVSAGMFLSDVACFALAPSAPWVVYAQTQEKLWRSDNAGGEWRPLPDLPLASRVVKFAVHPEDPDIVFALVATTSVGTRVDLWKSLDGGKTWQAFGLNNSEDLLINPLLPSHIFVGSHMAGSMAVYVSVNGGDTFALHPVGSSERGYICAVSVDPNEDTTIYAGARYWNGTAYQGGIFKTLDGGVSWENITSDLFTWWEFIWQLAVDLAHPDIVYARSGKDLFRSLDGGLNWVEIAPFEAAVFHRDPGASGRIFAAGASGFFASRDYGETWDAPPEELTLMDFSGIDSSPLAGTVWVATHSGGLYKNQSPTGVFGLSVASGFGGQTFPLPGYYTHASGTSVAIEAMPEHGFRFKGWQGDVLGPANPAAVVMDGDKAVRAEFWLSPPAGFAVTQKVVRSLLLVQYVNVLTWQPIVGVPDLKSYRLYRSSGGESVLLAELPQGTAIYWDRGVKRNVDYRYTLVAIDTLGGEGEPTTIGKGTPAVSVRKRPALFRRMPQ